MRVGVIHKDISPKVGGGDIFLIYLLRALKEKGHNITLLTERPTDWETIERDLGWVFKPDNEGKLPSLGRAGLIRQFLPSPTLNRLKHECDVTFNSYGHNLHWNTDLIYMHTPPTLTELNAKYNRNIVTKTYYWAYRELAKAHRLNTRVLTNSQYSRDIIAQTLKLDAKIVYPPIDTQQYRQLLAVSNRKNHVATISRFSKEKQLDIIPEIASHVKGAVFHIIGTTAFNEAPAVVESILWRCKALDVIDRVKLHLNASHKEKMEILSTSKIYLHTRRNEYFGMAVAEAMSAGLAPVVPDEGGQREIVPSGEYTYNGVVDAVGKVKYWLDNWCRSYAAGFSERAERFSYERFREEIDRLICDGVHV